MDEHPVILFDGVCNFCNAAINFILRQDKKGIIRFAPIQSAAGQQLLLEHGLTKEEFSSFILIDNNKIYRKASATLRVLNYLPWYWKEVQIFRIVPGVLLDSIYDFVAQNRYKWFGRREFCIVPNEEQKGRFLT